MKTPSGHMMHSTTVENHDPEQREIILNMWAEGKSSGLIMVDTGVDRERVSAIVRYARRRNDPRAARHYHTSVTLSHARVLEAEPNYTKRQCHVMDLKFKRRMLRAIAAGSENPFVGIYKANPDQIRAAPRPFVTTEVGSWCGSSAQMCADH